MTFPQAVKKAFPRLEHGTLRARILELAKDGGDITSTKYEFNLTLGEQITFGVLRSWLENRRNSV